jgi:hypothetical protein
MKLRIVVSATGFSFGWWLGGLLYDLFDISLCESVSPQFAFPCELPLNHEGEHKQGVWRWQPKAYHSSSVQK